jgi:hypothetical protein
MKIRTVNEFSDFLDGEFAWRRKELTTLKNSFQTAPLLARPTHIRAGVAMLYAHWEGFVKTTAEAYITFVGLQRLRYDQLSPQILGLCFHADLVSLQETKGSVAHSSFATFVLTGLGSRAQVPKHGVIETKSNLNAKRFHQIVDILDLDFNPYELKQNIIDAQLLNWRNTIAHGQYICPSDDEFESLYQNVSDFLRNFKDQLENAAVTGRFRRS